ncbi:MAG: hypothetical protein JWP12_1277 [Bacteroidetes bacterium]|nr:hypothetical protein [Bacteroidota bacterium]
MYIVIVHASRIPPHIGIIADQAYHSLSIKGQELNVPVAAFIRNTTLRKIPCLFIRINAHPVYDAAHLKAHFISSVQQFSKVAVGSATCLSPVKLFFEETYKLNLQEVHSIFELIPKLEAEGLIGATSSLFIPGERFQLPTYSMEEINKGIAQAEKEAKAITKATTKLN